MHGGAICAVTDQCLVLCADLHRTGHEADKRNLYTGSIEVTFRGPILAPGTILVECWLEAKMGRKWFTRGRIKVPSDSILAEAKGWIMSKSQML